MNTQEIIDKAMQIASGAGSDPTLSPVADAEVTAIALFQNVVRTVYSERAVDDRYRFDITEQFTIPIVAGAGTLPDRVMRKFLAHADFFDDLGNQEISFVRYRIDSNGNNYTDQLGYVRVSADGSLVYGAPGDPAFTGDLYCVVPSFPSLPADPTTEVGLPDDVQDEIVIKLAKAIRGEFSADEEKTE